MKIQHKTISGVDFTFERVANPRNDGKHWEIKVSKTGRIEECFPGKTLKEKIKSIEDVARVCGQNRFKADSELP